MARWDGLEQKMRVNSLMLAGQMAWHWQCVSCGSSLDIPCNGGMLGAGDAWERGWRPVERVARYEYDALCPECLGVLL